MPVLEVSRLIRSAHYGEVFYLLLFDRSELLAEASHGAQDGAGAQLRD